MRKTIEIPMGFRRIWQLWSKSGLLAHVEWREDFIRKSVKYGFPHRLVIEWMESLENSKAHRE